MKCLKCGSNVCDGCNFCPVCGNQLKEKCTECRNMEPIGRPACQKAIEKMREDVHLVVECITRNYKIYEGAIMATSIMAAFCVYTLLFWVFIEPKIKSEQDTLGPVPILLAISVPLIPPFAAVIIGAKLVAHRRKRKGLLQKEAEERFLDSRPDYKELLDKQQAWEKAQRGGLP